MRKAYAEFDYKTVVASLSAFMNTELSAFYFDIRKDTLYCDPPSSLARKAALTTIDMHLRRDPEMAGAGAVVHHAKRRGGCTGRTPSRRCI